MKPFFRFERNPEFGLAAAFINHRSPVYFPPELKLDMIECNSCGLPYIYGGDFINADADSAVRYMQSEQYKEVAGRKPYKPYPPIELRTGTRIFYFENGKKEEGEYLQRASGEYFAGDTVYYKTDWRKIYNEKGKLIRE